MIRFSKTKAAAAAALLLLTAPLAAPAQPLAQVETPAQRQRLAVFEQVWRQVRDLYYDPAFNGVDWAAAGARYRPMAAAAADDASLLVVLRSMLAELRDAHTRILTPQQVQDRRARETTSAGVILFEVEGAPVVYDVLPGSPAAEAGLTRGMRVVEVNGLPVAEALARARRDVGASSSERAVLVLSYLRLIGGPASEPLRLRLIGADGVDRRVELRRLPLDARPHFEARRLPGGELYVRFDRFRAPVARLFREALEANAGATGLVLDLRSNTGGDGGEGARTMAPLLDRPTTIARLSTRTGRAPSALLGLVRMPMALVAGRPGGQIFAGPVAILVDEGTGSTSEVVAASLQEQGRARVFGARSCGCALGVLRHRRLANGAALAISEVGLVSGLGRRIEGMGVTPDVVVALRIADLQSGRDAVLEAAVDDLRRRRPAP
jgi:carboxyl-terminal processing protease